MPVRAWKGRTGLTENHRRFIAPMRGNAAARASYPATPPPLPCKARSDLQHSLMLNCVPRRAQLARAQRVHTVRRQVGRGAVLRVRAMRVTDVNHSDIHKDTSHRNTLM